MGLAVEAHRQSGRPHPADPVVLVAKAPGLRGVGEPASQRVAVVDGLEALAGVEQAEPDVGGAVADGEDPAVAGQQVGPARLAGPQLEPGLHPLVVVAGSLVVGAYGDRHRPVLAPVDAERRRHPGADPVAGDHDGGAVGDLVACLAPTFVDGPGAHPDDLAGAVVEDRTADVGAFHQSGAGLLCMPGQDLVELHAGADHAEVGEAGELGPGQLEPVTGADDPQTLVPLPPRLVEVEAHADQLLDRTRSQSVAADLVAGEGGLLQEQDVDPSVREVVGGR